ncbi:MAG: RnfABCDGE type electron transport complex subunit C [Erysipelotrichaceae bacterium]|nr:RnfABCDGE type electron transport complex subunit C [Erysipelotrichaceae bacterium]
MSILSGIAKAKLDGQKGLTKDKPILTIEDPDVVYIPLVVGMATDFDVLVKEGDHVCIGTKLAVRKSVYVPIYASVSGTVKGIEKRMHASKRQQQHIAIINDHKNERVKAIDIENPDDLKQKEIVDAIKELGIVGLGGSGFPTFMKYGHPEGIDTIIINGVECEPFLTSDHLAMKRDIKALFDGTKFLMRAAEASKAIIAIKEHKPDLFELLVEEAKNYSDITPVEVEDCYPMGWERKLVETITKKTYDRLPAEVGVIVNNSATAIAVSKGIRNGECISRRVVTMSGNGLKNPQNVDVAVGTPVNYIVEKIGGYIDDEVDGFVLGGGPMMGKSVMNDTFVICTYSNAITVLKKENIKPLPCLKCGECTLHCPAHLQPVRIMQAEKAGDAELIEKLNVFDCVECGMCTYICPSKIEVTDMVAKAKRRYQLAQRRKKA